MKQRLIMQIGYSRPKVLCGERSESFIGRCKLQAIETIVDYRAKEIGFILKVVISRAFPNLSFLENTIERSPFKTVGSKLLCSDAQQSLPFFVCHIRKTGKGHLILSFIKGQINVLQLCTINMYHMVHSVPAMQSVVK